MIAIPALLVFTAAAPVAPISCAPPAPLAGWATPAVARPGTPVTIGKAVRLMLQPDPRLAVAPGKQPRSGSFGIGADFVVTNVGKYRIALGQPAWIDVIRAGKSLESVAHAHGAACAGVAKMVDFDLTPGRYTLQLSGSAASSTTVMIAALGT